jgi:asparagine synthase (glutamine-hydrolysing)
VSGFAGVISLDGAPPDSRLLERMAQTLAFRGPDGTHVTTKPGAGFCFTFLRTGPAPQCPSQPCSLDGNVWLLGDIRLDGRDDLRRKLEQHGDDLGKDVTDEELVLRAWRRWREDSLPDLIGDYSFALWDAEARQLWCARDLMGARPFFCAHSDNWLYFSNTLNAIRCVPDISSALDDHFIGDFLLQGSCSYPQRTAFRDITRLAAGHMLRCSRSGLDVRRYASIPIEEPLWLKHEQEYVDRFRALFEAAVRERLPVGPAAIFMSGGLDSTSIAAVAVLQARKESLPLELRAFTVDYQPHFDDGETALTSLAAQSFGLPLEIVSGASYLPHEGWDESPPHMPEPCDDPLQALQVEKFRRLAQHSRIALNGYGGDGIMTGQCWPYVAWLLRRGRLARATGDFGGYVLRHGRLPPFRAGILSKLRRCFERRSSVRAEPPWLLSQRDVPLDPQEPLNESRQRHPWYPIAYDTLDGSWAGVLEAEDAAWTGVPVESRTPFLDCRVLRFLLRIPPVPLCVRKEILRRTMKGLLPEEVRLRAKMPFMGDLMGLQVATGQWNPRPTPNPGNEICRFVDWQTLEAHLKTAQGSLWTNLRPISLLYWLKAINAEASHSGVIYGADLKHRFEKTV